MCSRARCFSINPLNFKEQFYKTRWRLWVIPLEGWHLLKASRAAVSLFHLARYIRLECQDVLCSAEWLASGVSGVGNGGDWRRGVGRGWLPVMSAFYTGVVIWLDPLNELSTFPGSRQHRRIPLLAAADYSTQFIQTSPLGIQPSLMLFSVLNF